MWPHNICYSKDPFMFKAWDSKDTSNESPCLFISACNIFTASTTSNSEFRLSWMVLTSKYTAGLIYTRILHASALRIFVMSLRRSGRLCFLRLCSEDELCVVLCVLVSLTTFLSSFHLILEINEYVSSKR
jgi:hypothetical protein